MNSFTYKNRWHEKVGYSDWKHKEAVPIPDGADNK